MAERDDLEHLRLLAIFHYVVGALAALFSLFPLIHLTIGIMMLTGRMDDGTADARAFGWFFIVVAVVVIAVGMTIAAMIIFTGINLSRRTRFMFCLVTAAIECAFMPFGTVLGVFTIIVLQRPSVKAVFGRT